MDWKKRVSKFILCSFKTRGYFCKFCSQKHGLTFQAINYFCPFDLYTTNIIHVQSNWNSKSNTVRFVSINSKYIQVTKSQNYFPKYQHYRLTSCRSPLPIKPPTWLTPQQIPISYHSEQISLRSGKLPVYLSEHTVSCLIDFHQTSTEIISPEGQKKYKNWTRNDVI